MRFRDRLSSCFERFAGPAAVELTGELDAVIERVRREYDQLDLPDDEQPDFDEPDCELQWEIYLEIHQSVSMHIDWDDERLAHLAFVVFAPYPGEDEADEVRDITTAAIEGGGYPASAAKLLEDSAPISICPSGQDFVVSPRSGPLADGYVILSLGEVLEIPTPEAWLALSNQAVQADQRDT